MLAVLLCPGLLSVLKIELNNFIRARKIPKDLIYAKFSARIYLRGILHKTLWLLMAKKISLGPIWLKAFLNEGSPTFLNAAASARKAGYKAKNEDSFRVIGYENRKKFAPKIAKWLDEHGFSEVVLKSKVFQLMEAKETVFQKLKGAVLQSNLPEGHRAVATSGTVIQTKDGQAFGDGETLLEIDVANYGVQIKATEMALKVKGLFAPEKHEHSGTVTTTLQLTDEDRALLRQAIGASIKKLMEAGREKSS
jgi:hypothetical protein